LARVVLVSIIEEMFGGNWQRTLHGWQMLVYRKQIEHVGEYNAKRRVQKDKAIDAFQELLKPVQRAYYEASTIAKRALLAELIEFITRIPEKSILGQIERGRR
jgi:hypothetical protein